MTGVDIYIIRSFVVVLNVFNCREQVNATKIPEYASDTPYPLKQMYPEKKLHYIVHKILVQSRSTTIKTIRNLDMPILVRFHA